MIEHILFCSFVCLGVFNASLQGGVLHFMAHGLRNKPRWIKKPLYDCMPCMASFWGLLYFSCIIHQDWVNVLFFIPAVSGMNAILNYINILLNDMIE